MKKNGLVVKIGNIDLRVSMDENVKNHAGFVSLIKNLSFLVFQNLDKVTTTVDIEIPKASLENQSPTCEEFIGNV